MRPVSFRSEGLRRRRSRLRGDDPQGAGCHGRPRARARLGAHGPARGLCRADPASGGSGAHWDLRDRAGLDRALSRERAKDTTLDYQAGFAERRGILTPDSEILVSRAVERAPAPAREGLRRGMFAGLKLGDGADRHPAEAREGARERRSAFAGLRLGREASRSAEPEHVRLEHATETFARAWPTPNGCARPSCRCCRIRSKR